MAIFDTFSKFFVEKPGTASTNSVWAECRVGHLQNKVIRFPICAKNSPERVLLIACSNVQFVPLERYKARVPDSVVKYSKVN